MNRSTDLWISQLCEPADRTINLSQLWETVLNFTLQSTTIKWYALVVPASSACFHRQMHFIYISMSNTICNQCHLQLAPSAACAISNQHSLQLIASSACFYLKMHFIDISRSCTIFNQCGLHSNSTLFMSPRAFPCRLQPEPAQSLQHAMSSERVLLNSEFTSIDSKNRQSKSAMYKMECTAEKAVKW